MRTQANAQPNGRNSHQRFPGWRNMKRFRFPSALRGVLLLAIWIAAIGGGKGPIDCSKRAVRLATQPANYAYPPPMFIGPPSYTTPAYVAPVSYAEADAARPRPASVTQPVIRNARSTPSNSGSRAGTADPSACESNRSSHRRPVADRRGCRPSRPGSPARWATRQTAFPAALCRS